MLNYSGLDPGKSPIACKPRHLEIQHDLPKGGVHSCLYHNR